MTHDTPNGELLRAWADDQEPPVPHSAMAERLGISRTHMSNILAGRERPSLPVAALIEDMTEGAVRCRGWAPAATPASEADTLELPVTVTR